MTRARLSVSLMNYDLSNLGSDDSRLLGRTKVQCIVIFDQSYRSQIKFSIFLYIYFIFFITVENEIFHISITDDKKLSTN